MIRGFQRIVKLHKSYTKSTGYYNHMYKSNVGFIFAGLAIGYFLIDIKDRGVYLEYKRNLLGKKNNLLEREKKVLDKIKKLQDEMTNDIDKYNNLKGDESITLLKKIGLLHSIDNKDSEKLALWGYISKIKEDIETIDNELKK